MTNPSAFFEYVPQALDLTKEIAWRLRTAEESHHLVCTSATSSAAGIAEDLARARVRSAYVGSSTSTREEARVKLRARRDRVQLGLSNPAYLAAGSGTDKTPRISAAWHLAERVLYGPYPSAGWLARRAADARSIRAEPMAGAAPARVALELTPSRLRVAFTDAISDHLAPGRGATGTKRGAITELSDAARDRLADMACTLTETGKTPHTMLTLTLPANWKTIYVHSDIENGFVNDVNGGRLFKKHMDTFRKRLDRWLKRRCIIHFKALWFMEFQKRGAPHLHIILFDIDMSEKDRKSMRSWIGRAWANIVGNSSKTEKEKHIKAGTQVAKMKKPHFGYACKYAAKMEQKIVPEEFKNVGRFWGVWNYEKPKPDILVFDYSHLNKEDTKFISKLLVAALVTIGDKSQSFMMNKLAKVMKALNDGLSYRFSFSVFGGDASKAVRCILESQ